MSAVVYPRLADWPKDLIQRLDERWDAGEPYATLAAEHGISENRVRKLIHQARLDRFNEWRRANGWTFNGRCWVAPPGPVPQYQRTTKRGFDFGEPA